MSSVTLFCKGPVNADLQKVKNASSKQPEKFCDRFVENKYCTIKDGTQTFDFIADKSGVTFSVILKVF